jgi:hypothetical protein
MYKLLLTFHFQFWCSALLRVEERTSLVFLGFRMCYTAWRIRLQHVLHCNLQLLDQVQRVEASEMIYSVLNLRIPVKNSVFSRSEFASERPAKRWVSVRRMQTKFLSYNYKPVGQDICA